MHDPDKARFVHNDFPHFTGSHAEGLIEKLDMVVRQLRSSIQRKKQGKNNSNLLHTLPSLSKNTGKKQLDVGM
jgi:hypothetical protein